MNLQSGYTDFDSPPAGSRPTPPGRSLVRTISDIVIVLLLVALAICLYGAASIHPRLSLNQGTFIRAEPVLDLPKGNGPNLASTVGDFAANRWRADDVTVIRNAGAAPDGTNDAYRVQELKGGDFHRIETQLAGTNPGKSYVLSLFVRPGQTTAIRFEMRDHNDGKYGTAVFDLAREAVVGATADVTDAGMQKLPDGWLRCWAAMPYATDEVVFNFALVNKSGESRYRGDGRSDLLIWGVQFEPGDSGPHGYNGHG